jgi:hypothetical protein
LFLGVPLAIHAHSHCPHTRILPLYPVAHAQAAITGLREGLVSRTEGDPRLMPELGAPLPKVAAVKAHVMRESAATAGADGKGKSARLRTEEDGVTAR